MNGQIAKYIYQPRLTKDPNFKTRTGGQNSQLIRGPLYFQNPCICSILSQKSAIPVLFKDMSIDPLAYSPPSLHRLMPSI